MQADRAIVSYPHVHDTDIWSADVMVAAELERTARPGHVHITSATRNLLPCDQYDFEPGGPIFDESAGAFLDRCAHFKLFCWQVDDSVVNSSVQCGKEVLTCAATT